jgi:hypothetical protein
MNSFERVAATSTLICMIGFSAEAAVTQVTNINDPVNRPYVQTASNFSCASNAACIIDFPATTAKETPVQHVSCSYSLLTNVNTLLAVGRNRFTRDFNILPVFTYATASGSAFRGVNENTYLFLNAGDEFEVEVDPTGGAVQFFQCTISGYHNQ